jgi:hypothetical protein
MDDLRGKEWRQGQPSFQCPVPEISISIDAIKMSRRQGDVGEASSLCFFGRRQSEDASPTIATPWAAAGWLLFRPSAAGLAPHVPHQFCARGMDAGDEECKTGAG